MTTLPAPYWRSDCGRHTLYHGDCLAILPHLSGVDCVVTDPPFGLDIPYNTYLDTKDNLERLVKSFMPECMRAARRTIITPGITQLHFYPAPTWIGCVAWNTTGSFGKYGFTQWTPVLLYGSDVAGFGSLENGALKSDTIYISGGGGVGFMRKEPSHAHPCPKPRNIMVRLLERYAEPESTVLDPFAGSGTTGVACAMTGRRFIGIELDEGYCAIAKRRIEEAANHLFVPTETNPPDADPPLFEPATEAT